MLFKLRRMFDQLFGPRLPVRLELRDLRNVPQARIRAAAQLLRLRLEARFPDEPPWAEPPEDPWSRVREPRRFGPGGRSNAVAVDEPDDVEAVLAIADGAFSKR
jgi:hypothetical protein